MVGLSVKQGYFDIHSHILPGMDDGPGDIDAALELAKSYIEDGASGVIATPHFTLGDDIGAFLDRRKRALCELREALKKEGLRLEVKCGSEIMLRVKEKEDTAYAELERNVEWFCIGDSNLMLVEFPIGPEPVWFEDSLYWLQRMGTQPVLAHAERYAWLKNREKLDRTIDKGIYLQVNSGSIGSHLSLSNGLARSMLKSGSVHFVATDSHDTCKRKPDMGRIFKGKFHYHLENARALFEHRGDHVFYIS